MMTIENRIKGFHRLGERIKKLTIQEKETLFLNCLRENPWFTAENVELSLNGIGQFLDQKILEEWLSQYPVNSTTPKKIGVAMAGNIPLVGFHDLLCVLLSGHQLVAKLSSGDSALMKFVKNSLTEIDPAFETLIQFEERLNHVDAVIATGSDNTSRYFEYYFRSVPHIIRKNRSSCAVILGEETEAEFYELGKDVFSYFGLGCRNVSKLYIPENFDLVRLIKSWEPYQPIINHNKYANNYEYQRSILLINKIPFYDSGFIVLHQNDNLVSPIAMIYYEYYSDQKDLESKLEKQKEKIQCIVSARGWYKNSVPFGDAQIPTIDDYADGVDTINFLRSV